VLLFIIDATDAPQAELKEERAFIEAMNDKLKPKKALRSPTDKEDSDCYSNSPSDSNNQAYGDA
jgi:hypothetical protein